MILAYLSKLDFATILTNIGVQKIDSLFLKTW